MRTHKEEMLNMCRQVFARYVACFIGYRAPLDNSGPSFPKPLARAMSQKQLNDPGKDLTTPLCHYDHANFFNEDLADESDRG